MVEYTTGRLRDCSVEEWPCSKGASCVVECTMGRLGLVSVESGLVAEVFHVWWSTLRGGWDWSL